MLNGNGISHSCSEQLEVFRKNNATHEAFVEDLVCNYEELQRKYAEKCDDYSNEVESRRMWQGKASMNERALVEQRQASGSNSFVLAIIDGDGAIFQDFLYALGKDGGADAAHQLHSEIKKHLRSTYPDASVDDWSINVQVILNLHGLATKLQACGIISNYSELFEFGRGFSLAQPLFSFIDVGVGKERADYKVRETLRVFLPNAQCKHVFFGPCSDTGYVPVLESYKRDFGSRITLLETRPAEPGFVELGLERVRFPRVFRSDNLPFKTTTMPSMPVFASPTVARPVPVSSSQMQPAIASFIPRDPSPMASSDSGTSLSTWATVGKNTGSNGKTIDVASKKASVRRHILLNAWDDRVDVPLPRPEQSAEKRFNDRLRKDGKFCNNFHLSGECPSGEYCDFNHGERLSPGEQLVLKHKARSRCCPDGSSCRKFHCTCGHHCKMGSACTTKDCWFADMHHINTEPAKRVFEDSTEEWIPAYLAKHQA